MTAAAGKTLALLALACCSAACRPTTIQPVSDGGAWPMRDWAAAPAIFRLGGAQSIDAFGDLHGDLEVTIRLLAAAGFVDAAAPDR